MLFYYRNEYVLGRWSFIQGNKGMIQEEIHKFIDNFKYFTAILAPGTHKPRTYLKDV